MDSLAAIRATRAEPADYRVVSRFVLPGFRYGSSSDCESCNAVWPRFYTRQFREMGRSGPRGRARDPRVRILEPPVRGDHGNSNRRCLAGRVVPLERTEMEASPRLRSRHRSKPDALRAICHARGFCELHRAFDRQRNRRLCARHCTSWILLLCLLVGGLPYEQPDLSAFAHASAGDHLLGARWNQWRRATRWNCRPPYRGTIRKPRDRNVPFGLAWRGPA